MSRGCCAAQRVQQLCQALRRVLTSSSTGSAMHHGSGLWLPHLSRMSAMMQEYISSPSGNWMATFLAFTCLMRQTVLWTCSDWSVSQLAAAAHTHTPGTVQSELPGLGAYPTCQNAHDQPFQGVSPQKRGMLLFTSKL